MTSQIRVKAACPGCKFVRFVTVWADDDGKPQDWCKPENRYCGVCEAKLRAIHYAKESKRFAEKAAELLARRQRAEAKRKASAEAKAKKSADALAAKEVAVARAVAKGDLS
jgi:hypothetical protein